jgi:hypothetical protein
MQRMQDIYRSAKVHPETAIPLTLDAYSPDTRFEGTLGIQPAAYRALLKEFRDSIEPGTTPTVHPRVSFSRRAKWLPLDTSRPSWRSEGTWRVTGTMRYAPKGQPDRDAVIGWETELRWSGFREEWYVTRVTTRSIDAEPARPRLRRPGIADRYAPPLDARADARKQH